VQTWGRHEGFFSNWPDHQDEYLGPNEHGWVGIRTRGQANNVERPYLRETWFDPNHGYAWVARRSLTFPEAEWQLKPNWQAEYHELFPPADAPVQGSVTLEVEWADLREGQWYPALRTTRHVERGPDGEWRERREADTDGFRPVTRRYILAEPLEGVDERWFEIPVDWLEQAPLRPWP
jgi:hypothetical protein